MSGNPNDGLMRLPKRVELEAAAREPAGCEHHRAGRVRHRTGRVCHVEASIRPSVMRAPTARTPSTIRVSRIANCLRQCARTGDARGSTVAVSETSKTVRPSLVSSSCHVGPRCAGRALRERRSVHRVPLAVEGRRRANRSSSPASNRPASTRPLRSARRLGGGSSSSARAVTGAGRSACVDVVREQRGMKILEAFEADEDETAAGAQVTAGHRAAARTPTGFATPIAVGSSDFRSTPPCVAERWSALPNHASAAASRSGARWRYGCSGALAEQRRHRRGWAFDARSASVPEHVDRRRRELHRACAAGDHEHASVPAR